MLKKLLRAFLILFAVITLSACSISFKTSKDKEVVPETNVIVATTTAETENQAPERYVITDIPVTETATATVVTTLVATPTKIFLEVTLDSDQDGLTDLQELGYGTDKLKADSDGDGFSDGEEVESGYNPLGSGKAVVAPDNCSSLADSEADTCYHKLSLSKNDELICGNIISELEKYYCVVTVIFRQGHLEPCEATKTNYPEMFDDCESDLADYLEIKQPSESNRDDKTVSDVKMIQTALQLYYNDYNKYPSEVAEGLPIPGGNSVYLAVVPSAVIGVSEACKINYQYKYTAISDRDYTLTYCLDSDYRGIIEAGINTANPSGIK